MTSITSMMRRTQTTTTGPTIAPTLTGGTGVTVESGIIAIHSKCTVYIPQYLLLNVRGILSSKIVDCRLTIKTQNYTNIVI